MAPKVVIVTGASRGLGLAIAQSLLRASHQVVLVARTESELQTLKSQYPSQAEYVATDLADYKNASKVIDLAVKSFGRLDGLVVNHGLFSPMRRIADCNIEEWRQIYDANVFSAVALIKEAIPLLRKSKGRIILTSSGAATKGYVSWGAYGSSKAALNSLVQHVAAEEPDITSVAIAPGRVDTAMQLDIRENGKASMSEAEYAGFVSAFEDGKLNAPEAPGAVIAKLSLEADPALSGKFLNWNVPGLEAFREGH